MQACVATQLFSSSWVYKLGIRIETFADNKNGEENLFESNSLVDQIENLHL